MSRRRPLCAWCGLSMDARRAAFMQVQIGKPVVGFPMRRPKVGWHFACADKDARSVDVCSRERREVIGKDGLASCLREIDSRGPGRVA